MDTSMRFSSEPKYRSSLRLHAKERFFLKPNTFLQGHAELDTNSGRPSYLALILRHFYPEQVANLGVGIQYDGDTYLDFCYHLRAKKEFFAESSGQLRFNVKGRMTIEKDFMEFKPKAAAELCWYKFDFQKDQDIRLKVGYNILEKVPYFQLCENHCVLNLDANGRWNVRFHL